MKKTIYHYLIFCFLWPVPVFLQQPKQMDSEKKTIDRKSETSCPYLTKNTKNNIVMSWGMKTNANEDIICFSIFNSRNSTFEKTIEIPSSKGVQLHSESMPKIIFKPNEEIIAVWGVDNSSPKRKYAKRIYYSQSFDQGKTWTKATSLVKDTASNSQAYYDIDLLPNGEAAIIWLDNRTKTTKQGSTLYYAVTNGKSGFQNEKPICETTCQCCRTDLFVDSKGNIRATFRDIINDTIRDMSHVFSIDGGKTFSLPIRISADNWVINGCPHTGPALAENNTGLHFAWYTMGRGEGVFYCNSKDSGKTFSQRSSVSNKPSAKHPQIITLSKGDVAIVWDETIKKDNNYNAWVGLQHRTANGDIISTKFITSDECVSEYPVIKAIDENSILVAWVQQSKNMSNTPKTQVFYEIVTIK